MFRRANFCHDFFFCEDCIGEYIAAKVGENVLHIRCPALRCNWNIRPIDCRSVVPKEVIDRWEAAICEYHITSTQNVVYCPFNDCSAPLVVDSGGKKAVVIRSAECPHCHRLFCARCQVPWHAGSKCKNVRRNDQVKKMDRKFRGLVRLENWKRCPQCNFYVGRDSGCEHISCRFTYNFSP
ncbi:hypothetical protein TIFTF001_006275 [Ficus carica]|uniref:RBR-type E3 ubiquitin transferase n=1 Tax=Ficus carica TaxID=3494 RepID=A0AA88A3S1_FICCA|nr:hypothetical protein TIFTF001_006275 [Ficus carica]